MFLTAWNVIYDGAISEPRELLADEPRAAMNELMHRIREDEADDSRRICDRIAFVLFRRSSPPNAAVVEVDGRHDAHTQPAERQ